MLHPWIILLYYYRTLPYSPKVELDGRSRWGRIIKDKVILYLYINYSRTVDHGSCL